MQKNKKARQKINPFSGMEREVLDFWEKAETFKKSVKKEALRGDYVFYDGPPFATGTPHYGHIVASIMKDVVPRFWTMNGYRVERKWGWDCHGLPIENIVEKELGSQSKKDVENVGVDKFNEMCCSKVLAYVDDWKKTVNRMGRWVDMENDYKTMDKDFMESVWWVFKQLWDKGLIYKGYRSMHICPRCETTLSQSEVAEGYKDIKDLSCVAKFKLITHNLQLITGDNVYILAWTTTPWTLIGNVALAVSSKQHIDYQILEFESDCGIFHCKKGEKIIIANDRHIENNIFGDILHKQDASVQYSQMKFFVNYEKNNQKGRIDFQSRKIISSKDLIGLEYKPLFDYYSKDEKLKNKENGWKVYAADFVTTEEGTGVVHIAPAFGEDDMELGKKYDLPFVQHLSMDGNFNDEVKDFKGLNVKPKDNHMATDIEIIKYLARNNLLFHKEKYEHSYPHCWRCDSPLLNYATSSWFVSILKIKDKMLKNAEKINWSPEHIKKGRWGKWLEGARDWSISRQRFWASVMPIWICDKCGEQKVMGSVKELEDLSGKKVNDLHKHTVDEITFKCVECKGTMKRVPDVLDCWFESGSMPYAQTHYPFENKNKFERNFPAEFIAEGTDQCRCWFYYLHALATGVKGVNAFKNVIVNGIVLAEDGKKMSKKLNNYPDPMVLFDQHGADALRYYLLTSPVMLADNLNFSEQGVVESLRKVNMTLFNVYKFYAMYVGDNANPRINANRRIANDVNVLDRWIIARLNQLIAGITEAMKEYNLPKAARPIVEFIDDLSTWYLRRSRDRFKGGDKYNANPRINANQQIANNDDKQAVLRTTAYVLIELSKLMAPFTPFIAEQIWQRVSGYEFKDDKKSVHLEDWPAAGKIDDKLLKEMEIVRKIVELGLAKRDEAGIKVRQPLNKLSIVGCGLPIEEYEVLIKDEVNVKNVDVSKEDNELSVELDTKLTPELKQEGIKRELVRFINNMRKNAGLTIKDRIEVCWNGSKEIKEVVGKFKDDLMKDTLSLDIIYRDDIENGKEVKVNGGSVVLGIIKQ